jgi:hypothetical protein
LILFLAGGIADLKVIVFYLWKRLPFHNAIWHGLVLAAAGLLRRDRRIRPLKHLASVHYIPAAYTFCPRPVRHRRPETDPTKETDMTNQGVRRLQSAQRGTEQPFTKIAKRDAQLRQERENSKAADLAKMAKLSALRLARDATKS